LFAASAGISFVLLDSQPPATFRFQVALTVAPPVQAAADGVAGASARGAHALWTGSNAGTGQGEFRSERVRSAGTDTAVVPQRELLAQSEAVNNIVPAGGVPNGTVRQPAAKTIDPAQGPAGNPGAKPAPSSTATVQPTKRPHRKLALRAASGNKPAPGTSLRRRRGEPGTTADMIGPYRIQVGSFRTPEAAHTQWLNLRRRHADIFGGYIMVIEKVHRGRGGVVYRLQAGPLKSRSAVSRICSRLSKRRIGCTLVDG
jgi:cell division protein FtsN